MKNQRTSADLFNDDLPTSGRVAPSTVDPDPAIDARLADHALYLRDRAAWARKHATEWVTRMKAEPIEQRQESWRIAGPELRAEIRRLTELEKGP